VLDERFVGRAGVYAYDPLRLAVDVRGLDADGYELARELREQADINLELAGQNVLVGVFGMGEDAAPLAERFVAALRSAAARHAGEHAGERMRFAPPPPWGELVMTPREAFLGAQEVVPAARAAGRVAAESLATYPPGIPTCCPASASPAKRSPTSSARSSSAAASAAPATAKLRTIRVVVERA